MNFWQNRAWLWKSIIDVKGRYFTVWQQSTFRMIAVRSQDYKHYITGRSRVKVAIALACPRVLSQHDDQILSRIFPNNPVFLFISLITFINLSCSVSTPFPSHSNHVNKNYQVVWNTGLTLSRNTWKINSIN